MATAELGRETELSGKEKDKISTSLLSKIKSALRDEVPLGMWKREFTKSFERRGKRVELSHLNPDAQASTTQVRLIWADPREIDHFAVMEIVAERPILSIAGKALWKLHDSASFAFAVDGETDANTRNAAERMATLINFLTP